jgi:uncharacterized protein YbaR (Trm112 family)
LFIDLIDALRCPADHPPSNLVAALDAVEDRDVIRGMLGCPVCHSEFQIRDGELWMATAAMPAPPTRAKQPEDDALRLAASLDLRHESGFALLRGAWCALAEPMVAITPTHLVLLDPPLGTTPGPGRSLIHAGGTVPFAPRTAVAAAVDDDERVYAMALTVQPPGRVVGPVDVPVPRDVRELLRDERWWVGERENAAGLVTIGRRVLSNE